MKLRTALSLLFLSTAAWSAPPVSLKVAAVQFRSSFNIEDNRKRMVETLTRLSTEGVNVAAFPECALTGYHKDAVMAAGAGEILIWNRTASRGAAVAEHLRSKLGYREARTVDAAALEDPGAWREVDALAPIPG